MPSNPFRILGFPSLDSPIRLESLHNGWKVPPSEREKAPILSQNRQAHQISRQGYPFDFLVNGFLSFSVFVLIICLLVEFFLTAVCSRDDAVYDEFHKAEGDSKPLPVDEDLPGMGQYYCLHCDRYFANVAVRDEHFKTKRHRKRMKMMTGPAPHTQLDAELAAGMGMPDNGPKLMSM